MNVLRLPELRCLSYPARLDFPRTLESVRALAHASTTKTETVSLRVQTDNHLAVRGLQRLLHWLSHVA